MALATNAQIQQFADQRVRVRAEQIRALLLAMQDDKAAIGDVYSALTDGKADWGDQRALQNDHPAHFLVKDDVLAYNTFITNLIAAITEDAQLPVVLSACVRGLGQAGVTP